MKTNYWLALALLGLLVAGCVQQGKVAVAGAPIKIGSFQPMTGEAASWGVNGVAGARLAVDEINAAGGVLGRKLELIAEDDKCSSEGVTAITKLINVDQVDALIGPDCSASGAPALPIAQKAGIPVIITAASNPDLTKIGDYIFRAYPSDAVQGKVGAEFVYNTLGKHKAAVVNVNDAWGQGLRQVFINRFKELGGEVVYEDSVDKDARDLKTQLAKAKGSGAEALYFPLRPAGGVVGFQQAKEIGLSIPIIGGDFFDSDEVVNNPASEGILYTVPKVDTPEAFAKKLKAVPGNENLSVFMTAAIAYDAVKVLAQAMERAGSADKAAVREALKGTRYNGVSNSIIEFDAQGDLKNALMDVRVIRGGKAESYR